MLIAGGDMRMIFCAEALRGDLDIYALGFDDEVLEEHDLPKPCGKSDCVLLPVKPLDEDGCINTPCYGGTLTADDISPYIAENALIICGVDDTRLRELFPGCRIVSCMDREDTALKNAIPTAEGAVMIALNELPETLNGMPVLIAGLGRIGTALALILKGFGADITAAVRNEKGAAKARILGIKHVFTTDTGRNYRVIFNTVPEPIFDGSRLGDDILYIELASAPGGIFGAVSGAKVIGAQGLPGRTAPVTAGRIIAESVRGIIAERRADRD